MASTSLAQHMARLALTPLALWAVACNDKEVVDDPSVCLAAGTRVATPDGWTLIEQLRPGDQVLAVDVATGAVLAAEIAAVRRSRRECLSLVCEGHELRVTPDHPIYAPELGGFVEAGRFALGQVKTVLRVAAPEARPHVVALAASSTYAGVFDVFDLTLAGDHPTFIAEGFVVHNKSTCVHSSCSESFTSYEPPPTSSATETTTGGTDSDIQGTSSSSGDMTGATSSGSTSDSSSSSSTGSSSTGSSTGTADETFPCGRFVCETAAEYCSIVHPGMPDGMISHACTPLPAACVDDRTCDCLTAENVPGSCSVTPGGGLQVELFAP